jgi:hypothetical protein
LWHYRLGWHGKSGAVAGELADRPVDQWGSMRQWGEAAVANTTSIAG